MEQHKRRVVLALWGFYQICKTAVVARQAATHKGPPPPLARVAGVPNGPQAQYYCENGRVMMIYTTNGGVRLDAVPTTRHC